MSSEGSFEKIEICSIGSDSEDWGSVELAVSTFALMAGFDMIMCLVCVDLWRVSAGVDQVQDVRYLCWLLRSFVVCE